MQLKGEIPATIVTMHTVLMEIGTQRKEFFVYTIYILAYIWIVYVVELLYGLMQYYSIPSALAMEILQYDTKPSIYSLVGPAMT